MQHTAIVGIRQMPCHAFSPDPEVKGSLFCMSAWKDGIMP